MTDPAEASAMLRWHLTRAHQDCLPLDYEDNGCLFCHWMPSNPEDGQELLRHLIRMHHIDKPQCNFCASYGDYAYRDRKRPMLTCHCLFCPGEEEDQQDLMLTPLWDLYRFDRDTVQQIADEENALVEKSERDRIARMKARKASPPPPPPSPVGEPRQGRTNDLLLKRLAAIDDPRLLELKQKVQNVEEAWTGTNIV